MPESLTRQQAWERLRDSDHHVLTGDEARAIGMGFGVQVRTYPIEDKQDMIDAAVLAEQICKTEGIEYELVGGYRTQLQECLRVLAETYNLDTGRSVGGVEL